MKPRTTASPYWPFYIKRRLIYTIGRFLLGILTDVHKWHEDEQLFLNDNRSKGAKASYLPGFMFRFSSNKSTVAAGDIIGWQEFRVVCKKWHRKLLKVSIDFILYRHAPNYLFIVYHRLHRDRRIHARV